MSQEAGWVPGWNRTETPRNYAFHGHLDLMNTTRWIDRMAFS